MLHNMKFFLPIFFLVVFSLQNLFALNGHKISSVTSDHYPITSVTTRGVTHNPEYDGEKNVHTFKVDSMADWMVLTVVVTDAWTALSDDLAGPVPPQLFVEWLNCEKNENYLSKRSGNNTLSHTYVGEGGGILYYVTPGGNACSTKEIYNYTNYVSFTVTAEQYVQCRLITDAEIKLADCKAGKSSLQVSTISSSAGWTVRSNSDWITPVVTSGKGSQKLEFNVQQNTSRLSRSGSITITSKENYHCKHTCTIVQPGDPSVYLSKIVMSGDAKILQTANFNATLVYSNGETEEGTGLKWSIDDAHATVNDFGDVTNSNCTGEALQAQLTVRKGNVSTTKTVTLTSGHVTRAEIAGEADIEDVEQYCLWLYQDNWGLQKKCTPEWSVEPKAASVVADLSFRTPETPYWAVLQNNNYQNEDIDIILKGTYENQTAEKTIRLKRRDYEPQKFIASINGLANQVKLQWFPVPGKKYFRIWEGIFNNKHNNTLDGAELICDWTKEQGNYCFFHSPGKKQKSPYYCLQVAEDANGTNASEYIWTEDYGGGYDPEVIFTIEYKNGLHAQNPENQGPCIGTLNKEFKNGRWVYVLNNISFHVEKQSSNGITYLSQIEGIQASTLFAYPYKAYCSYAGLSAEYSASSFNFIGGCSFSLGLCYSSIRTKGATIFSSNLEQTTMHVAEFLRHIVMPEVLYGGKYMTQSSPRVQLAGTPVLHASRNLPGCNYLLWEPVYGIYRFHIFRKGPDDDEYKEIASLESTQTSYSDYGVAPYASYDYSIQIETISSTGDRFWGYEGRKSFATGICTPAIQYLKIKKGPNLFSFTIDPNEESLNALQANLSAIACWNGERQIFEKFNGGSERGMGLIGTANADVSLLLSGTGCPKGTISPSKGWNLLGDSSVETILDKDKETKVYGLDNSVYNEINSDSITPGNAYWINYQR